MLHDPSELFGIFWANNAKESDGHRRNKVCQAQIIGSFQLLAAILNTGLDNGAAVPTDPVTGLSIIDAMRNALAAAGMLRPGGVLVYSTCTFSRRENEDRVAALLEASAAGELPGLGVEDLGERAPGFASAVDPRFLQLRPDRDNA